MSCTAWGSSDLAVRKYIAETFKDLEKMQLVQAARLAYPEKSYPGIIIKMLEDMAHGLKNGG